MVPEIQNLGGKYFKPELVMSYPKPSNHSEGFPQNPRFKIITKHFPMYNLKYLLSHSPTTHGGKLKKLTFPLQPNLYSSHADFGSIKIQTSPKVSVSPTSSSHPPLFHGPVGGKFSFNGHGRLW